MGTGVLDAINNKTIPIPVINYRYDAISPGFFYQNPFNLGYETNLHFQTVDLINQYIDMSIDERKHILDKSYDLFVNNYSIDVTSKDILNFESFEIKFNLIEKLFFKTIIAILNIKEKHRKL